MSAKKVKRISKRNKSAWRKTDIHDVEEYLEEQRQEERIGSFDTKKDEDLFVVDAAPLTLKRGTLSEKQKRKLNAKKPLKSLEPLINISKVQDPIRKRNTVKKKNGRSIEEEVVNPTKLRHFKANEDRLRHYEEVENEIKKKKHGPAAANEDLWIEKDFRDELPGLKDEKGWISRELALHIAKNVGKKVIKVHDSLRHRTTKAKNFEAPHPGISYNPSLTDHQDLIKKVVEREENIIKEEKHLKRVTTEMFSKVTPEERNRRRIAEMSAGLDEVDENVGNIDENTSISRNPPVQNKKKTKQERNRELRHRELVKKHEAKKALKLHIADLTRVKSLKAEVLVEEEKLNELKKRRKKTALKKKFEPKRLGRLKYTDPDEDVNMAEDIAGNLRNVKPESSLLIDRFKSFQKRNILPTSVATGKQKAKKIKRFPRSSHKDPGVSHQKLREQKQEKEKHI